MTETVAAHRPPQDEPLGGICEVRHEERSYARTRAVARTEVPGTAACDDGHGGAGRRGSGRDVRDGAGDGVGGRVPRGIP
ncbi:hypothetical protein GCM10023113_15290 [Cellulomonas oligotrophica]|uniref:Uncharacterized protein n=1 Tax=Cellulomonas oligotrophica TaxID=931536 RepID=A0ABQ4D7C8_9CELL|nr:hypothetical protein Col01nite_07860 [Cellulomonas oligotrophica]